ncbi:MAG TPA: ABC transporter ATP-binding protein [Bacteroidia bacterium]
MADNIQLQLTNLVIGYGGRIVLDNINVTLKGGTVTGLIANNGTGKSTLLKTLGGNLDPVGGKIELNGRDSSSFSHAEFAKKVAIVLTEKPQLGGFKVWDLVALGRFPYTNMFGHLSAEDKRIIEQSIQACGISELSEKNCLELSDGEFQKAMIARALAQQTDVLLLDEPTAFLDYSSKRNLFTLLRSIAEKENKIILVSSHDIEALLKYVHHVFILKKLKASTFHPVEEVKDKDPEHFLM